MKRVVIGFFWVWGLWSTGSTLEFFGVMPAWPLLLIGLIAATLVVLPRSERGAALTMARNRFLTR